MAPTATLAHPTREDLRLVDVLHALGHPIRLQIVRELATAQEEVFCGDVGVDVPKSTLTSHWRILREAGVLRQRPDGRKLYLTLRRDDLEERFPGLLAVVLGEGSQ